MAVLEEFEIPLDHVLCAVTDNAANMVKIIKDLNVDLAAATPGPSTSTAAPAQEPDSDDEIDSDDDHDEEDLLEQLELSLPICISHIRCGVHTLQLAIMDGLKNPGAANLVGRIRQVAVELRTPKLAEKLKKDGQLMAVLDQETRWGSTFLMIDRVLLLKTFVNESVEIYQKGVQVSAPQWKQIQELRDMLKKSYEVTKKMQRDDLTPGYFYRKWSGLRAVMQVHSGTIADIICASMKKREGELLNNSLFLAAIFLDIHNQDLLTTTEKDAARTAVVDLVVRMKGLNEEEEAHPDSPASGTGPSSLDSDSDEEMNAARKATTSQDTDNDSNSDSDMVVETEVSEPERASSRAWGERSQTPSQHRHAELSPRVSKFILLKKRN